MLTPCPRMLSSMWPMLVSNPRPFDRKPDALPLCHQGLTIIFPVVLKEPIKLWSGLRYSRVEVEQDNFFPSTNFKISISSLQKLFVLPSMQDISVKLMYSRLEEIYADRPLS